MICSLCQKSLLINKGVDCDQKIAVWGCGHCFHSSCMKASETTNSCPHCRLNATLLPQLQKNTSSVNHNSHKHTKTHLRPDLEGHF